MVNFRCGGRQTPPAAAAAVYLQYAALEEEHGLARAAMEVYDQAVRTMPPDQRLPIYDTYLSRASDFFGIAKAPPAPPSPPHLDLDLDRLGQHPQQEPQSLERLCRGRPPPPAEPASVPAKTWRPPAGGRRCGRSTRWR